MTVSIISIGTAIVSTVSIGSVGRFSFSFGFSISLSFRCSGGSGFSLGFGISGSLAKVTSTVSTIVSTVSTVSVISTVGFRLGLSKSTCQSGKKGYSKQELHG